MDLQSVPFPAKTRPVKSRLNQKMVHQSSRQHSSKEPPIPSQKRVFGTSRTNVLAKPGTEKGAKKKNGTVRVPKMQSESPKETPALASLIEVSTNLKTNCDKGESPDKSASEILKASDFENKLEEIKSFENGGEGSQNAEEISNRCSDEIIGTARTMDEYKKNLVQESEMNSPVERKSMISKTSAKLASLEKKTEPRLMEKSGSFPKKVVQNTTKISHKEGLVGTPKTPLQSSFLKRSKNIQEETPFHSAKQCSKCWFDRLETSSYWLSQIKLAQTGGKHFISAAFFRLAIESKAEPIREIRTELKRYLVRHRHLSEETPWRDVCITYGLLKDDRNGGGSNSGTGKPIIGDEGNGNESDQEYSELKERLDETEEI